MPIPPSSGAPGLSQLQATALYAPSPSVQNLATSQRTTTIFQSGQVVWDVTLSQFFVGDGKTQGGVLSVDGLTNQIALANGWCIPRHKRLQFKLQQAINTVNSAQAFAGLGLGNSIMEGDGTTGSTFQPPAVLQGLLAAYTGISATNWSFTQCAVGGSNSWDTIGFLADNADTGARYPRRPALFTNVNNPEYALVLTLRNDPPLIPIATYGGVIRTILSKLRLRGIDPILIIDPPHIDITTGAPLDSTSTNNWPAFYQTALSVAADEGASVVDVWGYWTWLANHGFDLRQISNDGTHPNNTGTAIMMQQVFRCMTMPSRQIAYEFDRGPDVTDSFTPVSIYNEFNGATLTSISTYGTLIGPTSRELQNAEFPFKVFKVTSGNSLYFAAPGPWRKVIVHCLTTSDATGFPQAINSSSNLSIIGTPAANLVSSFVRQYSVQFASPSSSVYHTSRYCQVKAVGGNVYILGVTYLTDYGMDYHDQWAAVTQAGTWTTNTDTYYSSSVNTVQSSSVGDTLTIAWYGSSMGVLASTNSSAGKFSYATDGGGSTTVDLYQSSNLNMILQTIANTLPLSWHSTVITVATKNASSSGNTVNLGGWRTTATILPPSYIDIALNAGEQFQLVDYWSKARILSVMSGSPTSPTWVSGQSTYTLGGTGAAIVRFER